MPGLGFSQEPAPSQGEMQEAMNSDSSGEELELENIEAMDTGDEPLMQLPESGRERRADRGLRHATETLAAIKMSKNVKEKSWTSSMRDAELQTIEKEPRRSVNTDLTAENCLENNSIGESTREGEKNVQDTKRKGVSSQTGRKRKRGKDDRVDGQADGSKGEPKAAHGPAAECIKPLKKRRKHKQETVASTSRPAAHSSRHSTAAANANSHSQSAGATPFTGLPVSGKLRTDTAERFNKEASPSYDLPLLELRGRPSSGSSMKHKVRASRKGPAKSTMSAIPPSNADTRRQLNAEKQAETEHGKYAVMLTQSRLSNRGSQQPGSDHTAHRPQPLTQGSQPTIGMMADAAGVRKAMEPPPDNVVSRDPVKTPGGCKAEKNTRVKRAERLERRPVQGRGESLSEPPSKQVSRKSELEGAGGSGAPHGLEEQEKQLNGRKIAGLSQAPVSLESSTQEAIGRTEPAPPHRAEMFRELEELAHPRNPAKAGESVKSRESGKNQESHTEEASKEIDTPKLKGTKSAMSRDAAEPAKALQSPESGRASVVAGPIESAEREEPAKPRKVLKPKGRSKPKKTAQAAELSEPKGSTIPNESQKLQDSVGQQESVALQQAKSATTPNGDVKKRRKFGRPWKSRYIRKSEEQFRKPQNRRGSGHGSEVVPPAVSKQTKSLGQRQRSMKTGRFQKTKKSPGMEGSYRNGKEVFEAPAHRNRNSRTQGAEESRGARTTDLREFNIGQRISAGGQDLETPSIPKTTEFDTRHPKNGGIEKNHHPAANLDVDATDAGRMSSGPLLNAPTRRHLTSPTEVTKYIQALVDYGHMEARDSLMKTLKSAFDEFQKRAESIIKKARLDADDVLPVHSSESPTAREKALMDEITQLRRKVTKLNAENARLIQELCDANELCAAQRVLLEKNPSVAPDRKTFGSPWSPNGRGRNRSLSNETSEGLREAPANKKSKMLDGESPSSYKLKRDRIMNFIRTCEGPITAKKIASTLGVNERTSRRYLKVLRESGQLQLGSKRAADSSVQYLLRDEQAQVQGERSSEEYEYVA